MPDQRKEDDLNYEQVALLLENDVIDGNVRHLLALGTSYNLKPFNNDGRLLTLALETPNFDIIRDTIVTYLVQVHGWKPTARQIVDAIHYSSLNDIDKVITDRFALFAYVSVGDEAVITDTYLTLFLQRQYKRILAEYVVRYHTFARELVRDENVKKKLSDIIRDLPPFPRKQEAVSFAKKYEADRSYPYIPDFNSRYKKALELFPINNDGLTRITLTPVKVSAQARLDRSFSILRHAMENNVFDNLSDIKLRLFRDKVLEAGAFFHVDTVLQSVLVEASTDQLAQLFTKLFRLAGRTLPCKNQMDLDIFTQDNLANIFSLFIFVHDGLCFEIGSLRDWVRKNESNPVTRRIFTSLDIQRLRMHLIYLIELAQIIDDSEDMQATTG